MAASVPNPAKGTILSMYHGVAVNGSFASIGQIVSIDGPGRKVGTRDTTILTSAATTLAATIVKNEKLSGKLLYDPKSTDHGLLETAIGVPSLDSWKVTLADSGNSTLTFSGVLTDFTPTGIEVEANLEASFEVSISGLVTLT